MLNAIHSESLFSLLTSIRTTAPPPPVLIPKFGPLHWGDVLEIQGPSGSGKTQLLYSLLATCLIPTSHKFISLGGWGKAAVVFDTEGTFDMRKFRVLLITRLARALSRSNDSSDDTQLLAEMALRKLHIFRPVSTAQLAISICNLPAYQTARMPDADIALVAVDSLSAFYWPDRFTAEQLRPLGLSNNSSTPLQHVFSALQRFRISHNPITVLTNWALNPTDSSSPANGPGPIFYKQHLPLFPALPDSAAVSSHSIASDGTFKLTRIDTSYHPVSGTSPPVP
ncbi:hypothetical protein B0H16DRAFT_1708600 [Mycena metata]|uniref:Rad51-like C-terminal domain-containing protein n=1 Tax=Mycena metata TaxID=1033252 RepID=A0AAD7P2Z7_9AGAR|nr:hypothetical protein B0H16DRAFT_1708600 [Mycena metata]